MTPPKDHDAPLSCAGLASCIGPRRQGRPTNPETVRAWMLQGVQGVLLASELSIGFRTTTWRKFLAFRQRVAEVKEERRQRLREAARGTQRGSRSQREAARWLEKMGAR